MIGHYESIKPYFVECAHLIGLIVIALVLKNLLEARNGAETKEEPDVWGIDRVAAEGRVDR